MAVTVINVGTSANDNTGDTLRNAFIKTNTNFDILSTTSKLTSGDLQVNGVNIGKGVYGNVSNTAIGSLTLQSSDPSIGNTALGYGALKLTEGNRNTAVGAYSMELNTQGFDNVAVGESSLYNNLDGEGNTAIGRAALNLNSTGNNNTAIGKNALFNNTIFSNSTGLGNDAQVTDSNQIQLGSGVTTCYTYGALQNRSDLRDKTEVRDTVLGLDFINELRPVDYKWDMREDYRSEMPIKGELSEEEYKILINEWLESVKLENITQDGTHTRNRYHHGLIAQEVQDVIEASGVDFGGFQDHKVNGGGDVLTIGYTELIAPMIKAIQELTARINVLEGN
jgi:hypothetical protein